MAETEKYKFAIPQRHKSIIKVIGVGGGGSNAVNHMYEMGIKDVEFVVCNTDAQALKSSPVPNQIQIGVGLTEGLGAGANPEKGQKAASESSEEIRTLLEDGTKMLFITAGMGGGTGTGAAPVIAEIAQRLGILTVGIVTYPFSFEGKKKFDLAEIGVDSMKEQCDTVITISNDKLRDVYGSQSLSKAFSHADNVLSVAAKGIAEIITVAGYVNVDFEDVNTVMRNAGAAVMGSGIADGEERSRKAVEEALASPLLNNRHIRGAKKVLLSVNSGPEAELQMDEMDEITEFIRDQVGDDAEMIFGTGIEESLDNKIQVTVIATGFEQEEVQEPQKKIVRDIDTGKIIDEDTPELSEDESQIDLFSEGDEEIENLETEENSVVENESSFEFMAPVPVDEEESVVDETEIPEEKTEEMLESSASIESVSPEEEVSPEEKKWTFGVSKEKTFEEEAQEQELQEVEKLDDVKSDSKSSNAIDGITDDLTEGITNYTVDNSSSDEEKEDNHEVRPSADRWAAKRKNAEQRLEQIRKSWQGGNEGGITDKLKTPAYIRKERELEDVPKSSDSNISRFNLNDDNQIVGSNRFLHDNVD